MPGVRNVYESTSYESMEAVGRGLGNNLVRGNDYGLGVVDGVRLGVGVIVTIVVNI